MKDNYTVLFQRICNRTETCIEVSVDRAESINEFTLSWQPEIELTDLEKHYMIDLANFCLLEVLYQYDSNITGAKFLNNTRVKFEVRLPNKYQKQLIEDFCRDFDKKYFEPKKDNEILD